MTKQDLLNQLEISDRTWRRWCAGLGIASNQASYSEVEVDRLTQLKELLAAKVTFDDAIGQITGQRPQPKQAPGRYSNLPSQLQPKTVAGAMVQQFDQEVMQEFFTLLQKPMTRQEIEAVWNRCNDDAVVDAYLLEGYSDE